MKLMKYFVLSILLIQSFGCCAMDVPNKLGMEDLNQQLIKAVQHNKYEQAKTLLDQGADPNTRTPERQGSQPVLQLCVHMGAFRIAQLLISKGADLNAQDKMGYTALMQAVFQGQDRMIEFLLQEGADVGVQHARDGNTALMYAVGKPPILWLLLTTIPLREQEKILKVRATILGGQFAFRKTQPILPKDVRKLITKPLVDELIAEQIRRVEQLISIQNNAGRSLIDLATFYITESSLRPDVEGLSGTIRMLDPNNPNGRARIFRQVRNNVLHLLFDEPARLPKRNTAEDAALIERINREEEQFEAMRLFEESINEMTNEEVEEMMQSMGLQEEFEKTKK